MRGRLLALVRLLKRACGLLCAHPLPLGLRGRSALGEGAAVSRGEHLPLLPSEFELPSGEGCGYFAVDEEVAGSNPAPGSNWARVAQR